MWSMGTDGDYGPGVIKSEPHPFQKISSISEPFDKIGSLKVNNVAIILLAFRRSSILNLLLNHLYLEKKNCTAVIKFTVEQQQCDFSGKVYN